MSNPYAPPSAAIAPPVEGLPRTFQLALHATLGLKTAQLLATLWLWTHHSPLPWSALDLLLHFAGVTLALKRRRAAALVWLVAAAWGMTVASVGSRVVPGRVLYLVLLPLLLVALTLRHWRALGASPAR